MKYRCNIPAVVIGLAACGSAGAVGPGSHPADSISLELSLAPALVQQTPESEAVEPEPPPFGTGGSWRWYLQGGWAFDIQESDNQFVLLGAGVSYFMTDYLSLNLELNGMAFWQFPGSDGVGINVALLFRWHCFVFEKWTLFADGGAGMLGTTAPLPGPVAADPRGGTKFNFTPQVGAGFTYELGDNVRFVAGVRWYHISNANRQENNPGRDSIMMYAGIDFPF